MNRDEERFRIRELLWSDGDHQIALAEDVFLDDKLVCVKTVAYDADSADDKRYVGLRRKALHDELGFLALPVHLLPEPLDWIQTEFSDVALPREPLLVYEYVHGRTLHEMVTSDYPDGIAATRALRIIRELARFLQQLHEQGWVFRNLDPRHVIISHDDIIHVVGCGNATPKGEAPNVTRAEMQSAYAAPEIRGERSGKFLRPAADAYALGALLSFLLTGEEPTLSVENPLTKAAYDRLSNYDPPGVSLLVARCMQPLAKKRFGRLSKLVPFTTVERLPKATDDGFGLLQLPAPWIGAEPPEASRSARSKISAGPLISVDEKELGRPAKADSSEEQTALEPAGDKRLAPRVERSSLMVIAFFVFALILGAIAFFTGQI